MMYDVIRMEKRMGKKIGLLYRIWLWQCENSSILFK